MQIFMAGITVKGVLAVAKLDNEVEINDKY